MIKKVPVTRLRAGVYMHKIDGPWTRSPFWRDSFVLEAADVRMLADARIEHIWIDVKRGLDAMPETADDTPAATAPVAAPTAPPAAPPAVDPLAEIAREDERRAAAPRTMSPSAYTGPMSLDQLEVHELDFSNARDVCLNATQAIKTVFEDARHGRALDTGPCINVVESVIEQVMCNAPTLLLVTRLKNHNETTYMHSVSVCALMVALALRIGFKRAQVAQVGLAGLLHDLGKACIPSDLLDKPGALTPMEYRLVQTHTQQGHEMLRKSGLKCAITIDVAMHHHERMDGSGYPKKLKGDEISLVAKMAAVCDVYDTLTSEKPYKPTLQPAEALRQMAMKKELWDTMVFHAFIKTLGIYPVGTLVRLKSDRLAVVVSQDEHDLLKPRVKTFYSVSESRPTPPEVITLAEAGCTDSIVGVESPSAVDLDVMQYAWSPTFMATAAA
jgi:putative nucleotidyltransferase with HDIG domain